MHTMKETEPPNELTDEALLNAIAGGAVWAMESLYERYSRILYSLAYRMVADHQVAEDLLQDAFLSVWRRATSYSPQMGAARSWLISILHHRTIDYLPRARRPSTIHELLLKDTELDESTASPDVWNEACRSVNSSHFRPALTTIPTEQ